MIELVITEKVDLRLLYLMKIHYSRPNGFVGRSICYAILFDGKYYGHTVAGSSPRHLPGRDWLFEGVDHNKLVNNLFFHAVRPMFSKKYPVRNFVPKIIGKWRESSTRLVG